MHEERTELESHSERSLPETEQLSNEAAWYVNAKFTQPADSQRRPGKG